MGRYIEFKCVKQKPKTKVIHIIAKKTGDCLGVIQWYGAWRHYIFMPRGYNPVFDVGCLKDICEFIEKLETELKIQRSKANEPI